MYAHDHVFIFNFSFVGLGQLRCFQNLFLLSKTQEDPMKQVHVVFQSLVFVSLVSYHIPQLIHFPEIKKLTLTSLAPDSNIKTICLPISFDRFFRCYQHRPPVFISHKQILRFQGHELGALGMAAAGAVCAVHTALLDFASESFNWQVGTLPKADIAPETRPSQKVSNLPTIHLQGLR